jgi:hypothetical protein
MHGSECVALETLVNSGDFFGAEQFCTDLLAQSDAGSWKFWKTQVGYVCFLNEEDSEARYNRAPAHFEQLISRCPQDSNAWFWLGYLENVLFGEPSAAERLRTALALTPEHPYAALVLAGISPTVEFSIRLLQTVIRVQGNNTRALRELTRLWMVQENVVQAVHGLEKLVSEPPYIEHGYGIMNVYINDVLTGATHLPAWKAEAERMLLSLG